VVAGSRNYCCSNSLGSGGPKSEDSHPITAEIIVEIENTASESRLIP
jgi:hypothetical protein